MTPGVDGEDTDGKSIVFQTEAAQASAFLFRTSSKRIRRPYI